MSKEKRNCTPEPIIKAGVPLYGPEEIMQVFEVRTRGAVSKVAKRHKLHKVPIGKKNYYSFESVQRALRGRQA